MSRRALHAGSSARVGDRASPGHRGRLRDHGRTTRRTMLASGQVGPLPDDQSRVVTVSIGVADLRSTGEMTSSALLRAADQALYQAKAKGKNQVVVASLERAGSHGRTVGALIESCLRTSVRVTAR
jgi:predicted signal transduction protein with EAL and GGDEF domain